MTAAKKEADQAAAPNPEKSVAAEVAPAPKVRAAVSEGLNKAGKAFAETKAFSKENFAAVATSASAATKGVRDVSALGVDFAKARIETNLAAAQSLNAAKSIGDVLDIQHAFAKSAIEAYSTEFSKLSKAVTASFRDTFTPLSSRASQLYAKVAPAR